MIALYASPAWPTANPLALSNRLDENLLRNPIEMYISKSSLVAALLAATACEATIVHQNANRQAVSPPAAGSTIPPEVLAANLESARAQGSAVAAANAAEIAASGLRPLTGFQSASGELRALPFAGGATPAPAAPPVAVAAPTGAPVAISPPVAAPPSVAPPAVVVPPAASAPPAEAAAGLAGGLRPLPGSFSPAASLIPLPGAGTPVCPTSLSLNSWN